MHPSRKGETNILDLIITNIPDKHTRVTRGSYDYKSDYYLFDIEFQMEVTIRDQTPRTVYNYKRANFNGLRETLNHPPNLKNLNLEDSWKSLKEFIVATTNRYIPQITIKNKVKPAWIDDEVIRMSHQKKCAKKVQENKDTGR